jgi:hypothetical protein
MSEELIKALRHWAQNQRDIGWGHNAVTLDEAATTIERLQGEVDSVRQAMKQMEPDSDEPSLDLTDRLMGWFLPLNKIPRVLNDAWPNGAPGYAESPEELLADVVDLVDELRTANATLTRERDELRAVVDRVSTLTPELANVLGRPCFACINVAGLLRKAGQEIPRKAEAEQAAVIFWCLKQYLAHGDKWADVGEAELKAMHDAAAKSAKSKEGA